MSEIKLSPYQQKLCERLKQDGVWLDWSGHDGWSNRGVSGYLHWFENGKKWPEYEAVPGPTLKKLRALEIIERGHPKNAHVPEYFDKSVWRLIEGGDE
jgi:hypothetical protein